MELLTDGRGENYGNCGRKYQHFIHEAYLQGECMSIAPLIVFKLCEDKIQPRILKEKLCALVMSAFCSSSSTALWSLVMVKMHG
jgi:hypothetical protein